MNVGDRVQHLSGKVRGTITAKAIDVWGNPQYFVDVDDGRGDVLYSAVMLEPEPQGSLDPETDAIFADGFHAGMETQAERTEKLEGLLNLALPYLEHPDVNAIGFAYPVAAVANRIRKAIQRED